MIKENSIFDRAISDLTAEDIMSPRSDGVKDLIEERADGRIRTFGIEGKHPGGSPRRTEITVDEGVVEVHKNTGVASGIYSLASRFSQIVVNKGDKTSAIDIRVNPKSSQTNPLYIFEKTEGEKIAELGIGYGQKIDLYIADRLLGSKETSGGQCVPGEVFDWIDSKLQE